ncbi:hypothetical protein [Gilliamella sp. WF3-4]|jgi:hypothetical protein|uniref:hypothetical protein n=1 Tax=Gilliamella sp. WF3-4 TaxID=3120255 RepID=UPI00080DE4ED|nr:hypothetical protein [Gilliamella apicola]OCG17231.1 hypothetical protein A9G47_08925 [Gilliamella apicola]
MKKIILITILSCLLLQGCSDPKSEAIKNMKDGCILATDYSNRSIKYCECIAENSVSQLNEKEIKLFNKATDKFTQQDLILIQEIFSKITTKNLESKCQY